MKPVTTHLDPSPIPPRARVPLDDERDRLRRPHELIAFLGLEPNQVVVELGAGDGYTAMHILSALDGTGRMIGQNPPEWHQFLQPYLAARLRHGPIEGLEWVERPFDNPIPLGAEEVDLVLSVLTYHDVLYMNVDRAQMNRAIFHALRPGGVYVVVDHSARRADGVAVGLSLHRVAEELVIGEVEDAGFRLHSTADHLRDPSDDRRTLAWLQPQPRTDRFMLRFVKPR
jgi:predicted methyltransferase